MRSAEKRACADDLPLLAGGVCAAVRLEPDFVHLLDGASGIFVVINQIFLAGHRSTVISIASIIVMLLGLPAYMIIKKRL